MLHVRVHSRLFIATTVLHTLDSKMISIPLLHLVVEHLRQPLQVVQIRPVIKESILRLVFITYTALCTQYMKEMHSLHPYLTWYCRDRRRHSRGNKKTGPVHKNIFQVDLPSYTEYHYYLHLLLFQVLYITVCELSLKTLIPVPHKSHTI